MSRRFFSLSITFAGALVAAACQDQGPTGVTPDAQASVAESAGRWIVVFRADVADAPGLARQLAVGHGGTLHYTYEHALKGFAVSLPDAAVAALRRNPAVAYVEADREQQILGQELPTGIHRIFADANAGVGINGADDYRVDVDVAIIDTGIDFQQPDLNVAGGVNCVGNIFFATCTSGGDDDHYHGTHVAGTVGALDNGIGVVGVAPGARLWAVKVLNSKGSGYLSGILAGIDWVADHASTIEVANMSLGGTGFSQAEHDAIQGAVNAGVAFAVAAGNSDADANNYSPGGFENVLSVSALADFDGVAGGGAPATCRSDIDDTLADFSNWGPEIDIAAPGVCILSTYPIEKGSYGTISGTSMASPHAAGALALLASRTNPGDATAVYGLYAQVKGAGNSAWVDDSGDGITEPLLDVRNTTLFNPVLVPGSGGTTNQPPAASFTKVCPDLSCTFTDTSSDPDGVIVGWSWSFGDGATSSAQNPPHTYAAAGTYTVSLTVTDNAGATGSTTQSVTVSTTPSATITLSATARKVKSAKYADLSWSGATGAVDVWRGTTIVKVVSGTAYTDTAPKSATSATYMVCLTTSTNPADCSNVVTVRW